MRAQRRFQRANLAWRIRRKQRRDELLSGQPVDVDRLGLVPIGRDLQDGWPAKPAMREQHFFAKALLAAGRDYRRGNACEASELRKFRAADRERNQRWTAWLSGNRKLAGDVV